MEESGSKTQETEVPSAVGRRGAWCEEGSTGSVEQCDFGGLGRGRKAFLAVEAKAQRREKLGTGVYGQAGRK